MEDNTWSDTIHLEKPPKPEWLSLEHLANIQKDDIKPIIKDVGILSNKIESSSITDDELNRISALLAVYLKLYGGVGLSANQIGIDKRVCIINVKDPLILVNPVITEYSQDSVVYMEGCLSIPNTLRKPKSTIRAKSITVKTDNLGELVFSADKEEYKNFNDVMSDTGLLECVTAQHEIDHLNGILITDKRRIYSTQVVNDRKYGRNDRVMIKSMDGNDSKFIKYKDALHFIEKEGYILQ
jgi:peptide deformylase